MWTLNDIWAFVHVQSSGNKSFIILCNKFFLKVAVGGLTSFYWPGCKLLIFIRLFCIMLYPKWGFLEHSWHLLFMMSKMRLWLTYTMQTQFFIFFTMQKKILTQWKQIFLAKYLHNGNKNISCKIFTQCKHIFLYSSQCKKKFLTQCSAQWRPRKRGLLHNGWCLNNRLRDTAEQ